MTEKVCRGVRGATTAASNTADAIVAATEEILRAVIKANGIEEEEVASVIFTTTPDLTAVFPAQAARSVGWWQVALMGAQEMNNPNGVAMCIRLLIHWNTTKKSGEIIHVYMHGAETLRPDLYPKNKLVLNGSEETA